jgi:hypothetical protein
MKMPRFRFALRTLFAAVAILAVCLGWYVNRARRQREAASAVLHVGGTLLYDYQKADAYKPNVFNPKAPPKGPEWLRKLVGAEYFDNVTMVSLRDKPITDDDLKELKKLPKLENLDLSNTHVTSAGLVHIGELKKMKYLSLWNTQVDDDGLRYIADFKKLYALILDGTHVTDEGLKHLEGLTNLEEWLGLVGTDVTDAGLKHLEGLAKLRSLNLRQTKVTAEGVRELKRALPNTDISYGP